MTDHDIRIAAQKSGLSVMEYILSRIRELEQASGIKRTILAICPNSRAVIRAALCAAKRANVPVKFAATLNQVDRDGGYTGMTPKQFVAVIKEESTAIAYNGPKIIAVDHGGPWLRDNQYSEKWAYEKTMTWVKDSLAEAMLAGYDLLHIDPTVDISLSSGEKIRIETVAERTIELIIHCEKIRNDHGLNKIAYEVGTEEVHGGLADLKTFRNFLSLLKNGLQQARLSDVWPCFVVGKVGTDLHTTIFDAKTAATLAEIAKEYGCVIKGHYTDNVQNPEEYTVTGMGAANVGPEFTEREYDGLMELHEIEEKFVQTGKISQPSEMKKVLRHAVVSSGRWQKWLHKDEINKKFEELDSFRQGWLIKTGCRYIWATPEVIAARKLLYVNLKSQGIYAEEIVAMHIERAMDKYFHKFNLTDLNELL